MAKLIWNRKFHKMKVKIVTSSWSKAWNDPKTFQMHSLIVIFPKKTGRNLSISSTLSKNGSNIGNHQEKWWYHQKTLMSTKYLTWIRYKNVFQRKQEETKIFIKMWPQLERNSKKVQMGIQHEIRKVFSS